MAARPVKLHAVHGGAELGEHHIWVAVDPPMDSRT
jgi:hypothetical protein